MTVLFRHDLKGLVFCYEFCSVNQGFLLGFGVGKGSMVADY